MPTDHEIARQVATDAGRLLVELRRSEVPGDLGDRGDAAAHDFIVEELARLRPGDPVLSEEGAADDGPDGRTRLGAPRVWVVDPLDGTREFRELGRTDWAVHVALVDGQGVPVAGAVALPAEGVTLSTAEPPPAPPVHHGPPRLVVSRSRPPIEASIVARLLGGELVPLGSAGAKAMAVVRGDAEVYLHTGGQYEWDSCAPVAVAAAAGLHVSRADGSPLVYNRPDPWLPDLLVCRTELAPTIVAAVRRMAGDGDPGPYMG